MDKTPIRYGCWPSAWTAAKAAAASRDYAELRAGHGGLFWIEYRPEDARSRLWFRRDGAPRCLTPPGFSVCSRVYEYGGGAFCLTAPGLAFVNEADQQVYRQALADSEGASAPPLALTARPSCRYGDLHYAAAWRALLAVEEEHAVDGVRHRLVSLSWPEGRRRVIAAGADFYAAPSLSPDGRRLAWIEWDRPAQPWTATRLCLAQVDGAGQLGEPSILAGKDGRESLQQPRFAADGRLYCLSDRHGWWQPWVEAQGRLRPVGRAARTGQATE
ncbi:MAG: TolB family protein, partial [Pseudomonas sp.]